MVMSLVLLMITSEAIVKKLRQLVQPCKADFERSAAGVLGPV